MRKIFYLVILLIIASASAQAEEAYSLKDIARQYRQLGYTAQEKGDLQTARQFYEKAIVLDPSYAVAHNDLGIIYETLGALDRAEREYLRAIEAKSDYMPAYTNLALLYEKEKRWQEAEYYRRQRRLHDPKLILLREKARKYMMLWEREKGAKKASPSRKSGKLSNSFNDSQSEDDFRRAIQKYFWGGYYSVK